MKLSLRLVERPPLVAEIVKQLRFGVALGLTNTAKEGQKAVMKSLGDTFTLRGGWFNESNKYGIKIKMATKDSQEAEVRTRADWLEIHEAGGTKKPASGGRLAIPTSEVRRNKKNIIAKANRPSALRGKRTFIIKTSKGDVLFQRKGRKKKSRIVALYNLEPRAEIKKQSTFFEPLDDVVKKHLDKNIEWGIKKAFATMNTRGRVGSYSKR